MTAGPFQGQACGLAGGFIPFAKTNVERVANGHPRPSLEERYRTHEDYVRIVGAAAAKLVQERYLRQRDANAIVKEAEASDVLR